VKGVVESWLALFRRLECLPPPDARSEKGACILVRIILDLSSDLNVTQFANMLSTARPKDSPWPYSNYERVLRAYQKVSQYKSAAEYIEHMVCKHQTWELQFASGGPYELHATGAQPVGTGNHGLYHRSGTDASAKKRRDFQSVVAQRLGKSLAKVETSITKAMEVHKKVHAEIQLLYHYAQHTTSGLRPRILCSNKEACYLCYLFITVHGQFHTPRSHGNFYPEWRLPRMDEVVLSRESMTQMKQVIQQFNEAIEERLKLLLETPRAVKPKPSESTIFSMGSTLPTALVSSQAANISTAIAAAEQLHSSHLESPRPGQIKRQSNKHRIPLLATYESVHDHTRSIANTDAEMISTQSRVASLGVSQSNDSKNDAQISVTALTPTLRDSSLDALRSHSAAASENESLRAENSNAVGLPKRQTYQLKRGRKTTLNIQRGCSVHLILPKIHFEFIYESKEATSGDTAFAVLTSEWLVSLDSNSNTTHINLEDLTVNREVPCSNIFEKNGIVIHSQGEMVFMQVISTI
jgi:hypothetical protein